MSDASASSRDQKKSFSCLDCHKTFLRSEHLARHRLNHRPKQVFSCTQCPKEFVRADLLQRHQKRHEKGMHYRSTGGVVRARAPEEAHMRMKSSSHSPDPPDASPMDGLFSRSTALPPPDQNPVRELTRPASISMMETELNTMDMSHHNDEFGLERVNPLFFDASADLQDTPNDLDWFFEDVLQKPPSSNEHGNNPEPVFYPYPEYQAANAAIAEECPWVSVATNLRSKLDGLSSDVLCSPWFESGNLAEFYDLYFNNYHPHFPILHRSTLIPNKMPHLLLIAIVALGSTLSPNPTHFSITTKVHEYLRWKVCEPETFEPPAPLWCLQALLLIQAHGKMFSTRKHHELAHIFHGSIITLMRRGSAYTTTRLAGLDQYTSLEKSWHDWVENESSKRTAFFAFLMDAQHSSLFGHTPNLAVSDIRLPLPCPDSLWDATTPESWAELEKQGVESLQFLPVLRSLLGKCPVPASCSTFARFILLHGLYSLTFHLHARDASTLGIGTRRIMSVEQSPPPVIEDWREVIDRAIDTWSFSLLSQSPSLCLDAARPLYRMAHVAIYTNIIDIHIVAGAPSLLGNLLSNNDKAMANARIKSWSEKAEALTALHHALLLIQETLFSGRRYRASRDNISLRPWCLYHATMVVWAYGFVTEGKAHSKQVLGAEDYLMKMRTAMAGRTAEFPSLRGTNRSRGLLLAVRESLKDCRWELLQEAYSTLGRLAEVPPSR